MIVHMHGLTRSWRPVQDETALGQLKSCLGNLRSYCECICAWLAFGPSNPLIVKVSFFIPFCFHKETPKKKKKGTTGVSS